jgi:hypothetical protein
MRTKKLDIKVKMNQTLAEFTSPPSNVTPRDLLNVGKTFHENQVRKMASTTTEVRPSRWLNCCPQQRQLSKRHPNN